MFYKCKVKKALGKMALWLLPKRGLLRVGAKANVPLCGGKKMNKKCAVGKKKKYRRVSKECRLTRCPVSIWSVFVCLSVKMVYFSCPSVRYCQVARSSVTLAANICINATVVFVCSKLAFISALSVEFVNSPKR